MSLARNTTINLATSVLMVVVSLVCIPLYLKIVGVERYGVMVIGWLLLGYMIMFDFGLGRAVTRWIGALRGGEEHEASRIFWTAFGTSVVIGIIALIVTLPAGYFAIGKMRFEDSQLAAEAMATVPWLALAVPANIMAGVCTGLLVGRGRFATTNAIDLSGNVFSNVAPLVVALIYGPYLPALMAASVIGRIAAAGAGFTVAVRSGMVGAPRRPDIPLLKDLLRFGGWASVSNTVGPILALCDRFVIGWLIGPRAVSVFSVPFTVTMRLLMATEAVNRALYPKMAGQTREEASVTATEVVAILSLLMTPIALFAQIASYYFFHLWVGGIAAESVAISYILVPAVWINAFALVALSLLQAQNRADLVAKVHLYQVVPYLVLLYVSVREGGVIGAAILWTARTTMDAILLFAVGPTGVHPLRRVAAPGVIVFASAVAALALPHGSALQMGSLAALFVIGTALAFKSTPIDARQKLLGLARRALPALGNRS